MALRPQFRQQVRRLGSQQRKDHIARRDASKRLAQPLGALFIVVTLYLPKGVIGLIKRRGEE